MSKRIIEIETIHAGQPRPYADSIYESIIIYSRDDGKYDPPKEDVKKHAKVLVRNFVEGEKRGWWEGYLEVCKKMDTGKWRIIITEEYTG